MELSAKSKRTALCLASFQRPPTHRWKFGSPAATVVFSTPMEFSRRLILRAKNLVNRAAKNSWNRIGISQPRILPMIFLPASRHFPASAPLAHRRTTSPCSSSISKRRVNESSGKNSLTGLTTFALCSRNFRRSAPPVETRNPAKYYQQPQRRTHWPHHPQICSQRDCCNQKDERRRRVRPGSV